MKTSNKILLTVFVLFLGTVTALAFSLRIRVEKGWASGKMENLEPEWKDQPLGAFTRLSVENFQDLTIRQGDSNSITVPMHGDVSYYSIVGDTLKIDGSKGHGSDIHIVVKDLRMVMLRNADRIYFSKLNLDSLKLESNGGYTELDSVHIPHLGLTINNGVELDLSNSETGNLWLDMKGDQTSLHCKKDMLGTIQGRWSDDITLDLDATTLANGITKIVHLP